MDENAKAQGDEGDADAQRGEQFLPDLIDKV
jgi:hypothetical protein